MNSRLYTRLFALLLGLTLMLALASCSGGSDPISTPPGQEPGDVTNPDNNIPPIIDPNNDEVVYDGQPGNVPVPGGGAGTTTDPLPGTWDFGPLIYRLPVDSQGKARVAVDTFAPGQKAAFVAINMNPSFLDAQASANGVFPTLPDSAYSLKAELVSKGGSSINAEGGASIGSISELSPASDYALDSSWGETPKAIYEREARARGEVPFAVPEARTTSAISKGEVRTFINVPKRSPGLPPIEPGPNDPDKDVDDLTYPPIYDSQDGRLVAVGEHCLIFLSLELNNGHPDNVRFTQERLNRMANEFDTNIFPTATALFGPVKNYDEGAIYRDVDRSLVLTGDDFDNQGNLIEEPAGNVDFLISDERKIIIFISNAEEGGFFTFGPAIGEDGRETLVGSTLYLGGDNFPSNDSDFNAAMSVMAHEFQHKLYHDNGLPSRNTNHNWLNEGLSQLCLYVCGYTPNSGRLIHWAIDSQLSSYLQNTNIAPVPMDGNPQVSNQLQYGSELLFFLYMYEHYDPGVGLRIYRAASKEGQRDNIELVERGAQYTVNGQTFQDTFQQLYAKFAIANFVDGISANDVTQFDDRFHYDTIDLRGTVNLSSGTIQLPGVRVGVFPTNGSYPAIANDRLVRPWAIDYVVFGDGDGRDLDVLFSADPNYRFYMLPVSLPIDPITGGQTSNKVKIAPNIQLGY
jgi:hypothetical protein